MKPTRETQNEQTPRSTMSSDAIFLPPDFKRSMFYGPPNEPADSDPNFIKHVHADGARFHVLSYSNLGMRCSEPRCIINKRKAENK